jgi:hypothetical protein
MFDLFFPENAFAIETFLTKDQSLCANYFKRLKII